MSDLESRIPFWNALDSTEQKQLLSSSRHLVFKKDCQISGIYENRGVMFVLSGQLRVFVVSEEGREVTLFRVFSDDVCVLAAIGLLDVIAFDLMFDTVEKTEVIMIPVSAMSPVMKRHPEAEAFLYRTAAAHFSDMVWNMQHMLFWSIDRRIARFLWDEMERSGSSTICLTHDQIARCIGSAREVVTRILKYFQAEGVLTLRRGQIRINSKAKLQSFI